MASSEKYDVLIGTFDDEKFTWHHVKSYNNLKDAYRAFKAYVNSQLKYTDEELRKIWDTGRIDIELRQGKKLLNWVGIYSREVIDLEEEEKSGD